MFPINVSDGKTAQQEFDGLVKKLEFLGFEKKGNWSIDCETYHQVTPSTGTWTFFYLLLVTLLS